MKLNGTIRAEFDVESFEVITNLCQAIGIVDENGTLSVELKNNRIMKWWLDEYGIKRTEVLYDQPFDVKYASSLMNLYELSNNYLTLSDYIKDRNDTNDYQTVNKLKIRKK